MTDSEYIDGIKKGDEEIFRKFVNQHQPHLLRLCNGFLHNHEDARDVVQETFIEVFQSSQRFRGDSKLSTWIYRIAVNKSLNLIRKNKYRRFLIGFDTFFPQQKLSDNNFIDNANLPDEEIETSERAKLIRGAVDSLPENQRIAFVLNKYDDLSYNDISKIMDISLNAVESLIHRAKINLQKKLFNLYQKKLI